MKFRVTGGEDGQSGISVGTRRYEAGDLLEMTQAKAGWLVERGLLVADSEWEADADEEPADEIIEELDDDIDADELDEDDLEVEEGEG
jgi:hypothetical protein